MDSTRATHNQRRKRQDSGVTNKPSQDSRKHARVQAQTQGQGDTSQSKHGMDNQKQTSAMGPLSCPKLPTQRTPFSTSGERERKKVEKAMVKEATNNINTSPSIVQED